MHIQSKINFKIDKEKALERLEMKSFWNNYGLKVNIELINKIWNENLISDDDYYFELETFFGGIHLRRFTAEIFYLPEHKYANLFCESHRNFILESNREIAKYLNQETIIYFPDSTFETSIISDWISQAKTFDEISTLAIQQFGVPPTNLELGIKNRFFLDNIHQSIQQCHDKRFTTFS